MSPMNTWWMLRTSWLVPNCRTETRLLAPLTKQTHEVLSYKVTLPGSETDRPHLKIKCLKVQQVRVSLIITNVKSM